MPTVAGPPDKIAWPPTTSLGVLGGIEGSAGSKSRDRRPFFANPARIRRHARSTRPIGRARVAGTPATRAQIRSIQADYYRASPGPASSWVAVGGAGSAGSLML